MDNDTNSHDNFSRVGTNGDISEGVDKNNLIDRILQSNDTIRKLEAKIISSKKSDLGSDQEVLEDDDVESLLEERFKKFESIIKSHIEFKEHQLKLLIACPHSHKSNKSADKADNKRPFPEQNGEAADTTALKDVGDDPLPVKNFTPNTSVYFILSRLAASLLASQREITHFQNELQSCKYTLNSQNGKRLLNRIRCLERENEELRKTWTQNNKYLHLKGEVSLRMHYIERFDVANEELLALVKLGEAEIDRLTEKLQSLQRSLADIVKEIETLHGEAATSSVTNGTK